MANVSENQKNKLNQDLLTAVSSLDSKKVSSLLKKGADPDMRNESGDTVLSLALSSETVQPEIIEALVENGAHLNFVSADRVTALMCAVFNVNVSFKTVEYLLQSGASVYSRDVYGQTPLLYATGREDVSLVDLLVRNGASVNDADADGNTLIFEAVRQGYHDLFSYLVDHGADLMARDYQGTTLLMSAILHKQDEMAHLLLEFSETNVLAERVDGLTAYDMTNSLLNEDETLSVEEKESYQNLLNEISEKLSERLDLIDKLDEDIDAFDDESIFTSVAESETMPKPAPLNEQIGDGFDSYVLGLSAAKESDKASIPNYQEFIDRMPLPQQASWMNEEDDLEEGALSEEESEEETTFADIIREVPIPPQGSWMSDLRTQEDEISLSADDEEWIEEDDADEISLSADDEEEWAEEDDADEISLSADDEEEWAEEDDADEEDDETLGVEGTDDDDATFVEVVESVAVSSPLNADVMQPASLNQGLSLYPKEVYQHALKMIQRYTDYQSQDGQKGVYLSGVYLTNKSCSQARVHIERNLIRLGYSPEQAHDQSIVMLYKLIRANGLYHPKEFVYLENGEKTLAFKVWGCDHRLLLKNLTTEFEPEGDWYHSLNEIEKYVGEKGEGKLSLAS